MLKMDLEYNKKILFVKLDGVLNRATSYKVNNYLVPIILKHKVKYLVYNLSLVTDIDETGIDAILNTKSAILENEGKIYLCDVNNSINKKIHKLHIKKEESEQSILKFIGA